MFRVFFLLLALCITVAAQSKSIINIDGGKGINSSLNGDYGDLASAIQKSSTVAEKGTFWLILAKTKKGNVIAQTIGVKGSTNKLELTAIDVAEKYKFTSDFDLIALRVNCEKKQGGRIRIRRR